MPITIFDPTLRTGWESDTPIADTLLRRFVLNWIEGIEAQGLPLGGQRLRRDDLAALDIGRPGVGTNVVTLLAPLFPHDLDEIVSTLEAFYQFDNPEKSGAVFLFSPWPTPDLHPHGWTIADHPPLMLRPSSAASFSLPAGLRIEKVHDTSGLQAFEHVILRGFGMTEIATRGTGMAFNPQMLADERVHCWIGWEDDHPVSAASTFVAYGVSNVTLVATVAEAQRRGYGAAVTWQATLVEPSLLSLLIASAEGRPVYERMGYLPLFRWTVWQRDRSSSSQ